MSRTMKNALVSAAVLVIIAVASVTCLMLANAFLPKYTPTLDAKKIAQLQEVAPTGVSDETAIAENYFSIVGSDVFDLEKFNSENGSVGEVLAVYRVEKGENAGRFITETQTVGFGKQNTVLLTAYNKDNTIAGLIKLRDDGDYLLVNDAQYEALRKAVIGKKTMTVDEIKAATGATASSSMSGIEKNVRLSGSLIETITGEGA